MHAFPGSKELSPETREQGLVQVSDAGTCAAPYPWGFRGYSLRRPAPHGASLAAPAVSIVVQPGHKSLVALAAARGPARTASSRSCGTAGTPPSASARRPGLARVIPAGRCIRLSSRYGRPSLSEGLDSYCPEGLEPIFRTQGPAPIHHPRWVAFRLASWKKG